MNGIAVVSGVNGVGKGTVLEYLEKLWRANNKDGIFVSLSKVMREIAQIETYQELANMEREKRNSLRTVTLQYLNSIATNLPVFLDLHFTYEDGEIPDLSQLHESAKLVIAIRSETEVILKRLSPENDGDHPGRALLLNEGSSFVENYRVMNEGAMRDFLRSAPNVTLLELSNNRSIQELEADVYKSYEKIVTRLEGSMSTLEGRPRDHERF